MPRTIGNPLTVTVDAAKTAGKYVESVAGHVTGHDADGNPGVHEILQVRRIGVQDIRDALRSGFDDFAASRSDVAFLCLLYPVMGITLAWFALNKGSAPAALSGDVGVRPDRAGGGGRPLRDQPAA